MLQPQFFSAVIEHPLEICDDLTTQGLETPEAVDNISLPLGGRVTVIVS
jgi:hypothetical protein